MRAPFQSSVIVGWFWAGFGRALGTGLVLALWVPPLGRAAEPVSALIADRTSVERVSYAHRLGTKPAFEQALPPSLIERLVKQELKKEAVLKRVYGVEVTPDLVTAEVQRINTTTRAPAVLAELKAALGNDPSRFARIVARPIVVDRILRQRFENDDKLHATQRQRADAVRRKLLAHPLTERSQRWERLKELEKGSIQEVTWQITPRPAEDAQAPPSIPSGPGEMTQGQGRSRNYSLDTSAQIVQVLNSPPSFPQAGTEERKFYFEDLEPQLRDVLDRQLQKPGDVSAVIETPREFLLFVSKERTATALSVVSLSTPKRDYDAWLVDQ